MNRLTSAKIYVDMQNETKSDRFNEQLQAPAQLKSGGRTGLSQTNLAPLKRTASQAGDV